MQLITYAEQLADKLPQASKFVQLCSVKQEGGIRCKKCKTVFTGMDAVANVLEHLKVC